MAEGPHKGCQILIVTPRVIPFRFRDLATETRVQILEIILQQHDEFKIQGRPGRHGNPLRAVQTTFKQDVTNLHFGLVRNEATDKWRNILPSSFSVLRVSKSVFAEAAPNAYGKNTFSFTSLGGLDLFLKSIMRMAQHLRHINLAGISGKPSPTLLVRLRNAKSLRSLTFSHANACGHPDRVIQLFSDVFLPIRQAQRTSECAFNILDAVQVTKSLCCGLTSDQGLPLDPLSARYKAHHQAVIDNIRAGVAKELGIKQQLDEGDVVIVGEL